MRILGITAYFHDSSIAIIEDGEILFAIQEERLTRIKHDSSFPKESIKEALRYCKLNPQDIDAIVFFEKPFLKFERLLENYLAFAPRGIQSFLKAIPIWLNEKLFQKNIISKELEQLGFGKKIISNIFFSEHHISHSASAFYPSPFDEAIVLTMDGVGEWVTTSLSIGKHNTLRKVKEIHFPHSLGMLYSAFTYYCGFKVNSGEYKLMGLAPYGKPKYASLIKEKLINIYEDGSFHLNLEYFDFCTGLKMTNQKFDKLFNNSYRKPEGELKQVHMDLAASIQEVTEEIVIKICNQAQQEFGIKNLCLAGGVALNCVANGKLQKEKKFEKIFIQPASGDAGGAVGAALALYYDHFKNKRTINADDSMKGSFLGQHFTNDEILNCLSLYKYKKHEAEVDLLDEVARYINNGKAIGWFQGRMEFGPRALGARSIIADPRKEEMQKNLNMKIKFRESFRPFAPVVIEEDVSLYFNYEDKSPYMLMVADVRESLRIKDPSQKSLFGIDLLNQARSTIPATTHVDYSARIQTVSSKTNNRFYNLIKEFKKISGCSVLVNTSFNIRGEPIVCTPEDALKCFMGTNLDVLVLENFILLKEDQDESFKVNYAEAVELD